MDPLTTPVTVFLRYVLLDTPQGKTCLFFGAVTFLVGLSLLFIPPEIATWQVFRAGSFFLVCPVFIFLGMLSVSFLSDFRPSVLDAVFVAAFGISPFIFPFVRDIVA